MSDWTSGYVADVEYTIGYFNELNPVRIPIGLLNAGYAPPKVVNACELGFGQGLSIAMHAAAQPHVNWYGDDFNPDHVLFARWINDSAGADADLTDESFEQFCSRDDLPMFDSIGLHGIWTWVSPRNREIIIDFIKRKLNVGGVVYCSYNVMPGWASAAPIRELFAIHSKVNGGKGQTSTHKMSESLSFVERLFNRDPMFLKAIPTARERFEQMKTMPPGYLVHEYSNAAWDPMYFDQIATIFAEAKLNFACSAVHHEAVEELHYTAEQREFLSTIDNEPFRETIRDFMRNAQFRKDYWVKGARSIPQAEQIDQLRHVRVVLLNARETVKYTANTTLGEAALHPEIYGPILDFLADNRPHSVGEIELAVQSKGILFGQVFQCLMVLSGAGYLGFAQADAQISAARPYTRRLNAVLMQNAEREEGINYLASPVVGGGVAVSRFDQLFLKAWTGGIADKKTWADAVYTVLEASGQRVLVDGKPVETAEENRKAVDEAAEKFANSLLPVLQGLEIAVRDKLSPSGRKSGR